MIKNQPNNDLSDQLKKDLRVAKTKEEPDAPVFSAGMELTDDELDAVAGGGKAGEDGEKEKKGLW